MLEKIKMLALENKVEEETAPERDPGSYVDGHSFYSSKDVANHRDETAGVWISYKSGGLRHFFFQQKSSCICCTCNSIIDIFNEEIRFYL